MFWQQTMYTIIAFAVALFVVRLIGKKEVGQLTPWDRVSTVTLGALTANIIMHQDGPGWLGIWIVCLWGGLSIFVAWIAMKNRYLRGLLQGKPTVVVDKGKIMEESMRSERYNTDMLLGQLRSQGFFSIQEVEFALLEPSGNLSILPKPSARPVTPRDLRLQVSPRELSRELIMDGEIVEQNLRQAGVTREWLLSRLDQQGVTSPRQVILAELNSSGELYIDLRRDHVGGQYDPSDG